MEKSDPVHKAIVYWLKSAEHDFQAVRSLFASKNYTWCLFLGHLVLEKYLKAFWIKTNQNILVPRTHNLLKLAEMSRIKLNKKSTWELATITEFNLETRYPEDQMAFYEKCTKSFTGKYLKIIEQWQKKIQLQLKKS